ncbi:MAG: carboxypeptidase regulatory-like domain-containing protein [Nibricoccus sp.]
MHLREGFLRALFILFAISPCAKLHAQRETTASLGGAVTNSQSAPVPGARIVVQHAPTGCRFETTANSKGLFALTGLPVGGPYDVKVQADGYGPYVRGELMLDLAESRQVEIVLAPVEGSDVITLEKVDVRATRERMTAGAGTPLSREEIEGVASVENSLNEFASRDPRVVYVDPERGELAAAGQNSRFNSLSVDGVRINDQFGVTPNGFPSQGNPVALETIEAVAIELSPYDVNRGGFTGASINAVTRSGSNHFRGTIYGYYRDQHMRGDNPVTGDNDPFRDETIGFTFGGPILRNQLFFFSGYEHSQRIEPAPSAGFAPTAAALDRIAAASAAYGYDPGALVNPGQQHKRDNKYLGKIDWRLNPHHRVGLKFSQTNGNQPTFVDYTTSGRVSLSGHWYTSEQRLQTFSAQLFSHWSSAFQTESKIAWHRYESDHTPFSRFPNVRINGVPGADGDTGSVFIGTDYSNQVNALAVENVQAGVAGTLLIGGHRWLFGAELEHSEFENAFLQNAWGNYTFASINAYELGRPSSFIYQYMLNGRSPRVEWGYVTASAFLQDTWRVGRRLSLTAGMRLDYPIATARPHSNSLVQDTFGRRNDRTFDGAYVLGPRGSFALNLGDEKRTELRGGAGVFQGRAPGVWLSNAYTNDGNASAVNTTISGFSPDPTNQPQGAPAFARQRVDLIDDNFHMPTVARGSLTFDHKLSWQNIAFSVEYIYTHTLEGLTYKNINLRKTAVGPDGRTIYGDRTRTFGLVTNSQYESAQFTDVYLLTNTSKGDASQATVSIRRPLRKHWGASLSYTRSSSEDVSSVTSSTAATNFNSRAGIDPNDDRLGTTNYQIRDRVQASVTFRFAPVKKYNTKITLHYEGRSGRPFSYIFGTDVNGDSADYDNDLFYVPTGRDDPKVRWAVPSQADAFFAYLESNPSLKKYAGRIAPRNSERSQYQHRYDVKFSQEIPLWRRAHAELFVDILNFANLLNDEWGRIYAVSFPYGLAVANASYDPQANQYVYRFTGVRGQTLQGSLSRWQMAAGVRLKF